MVQVQHEPQVVVAEIVAKAKVVALLADTIVTEEEVVAADAEEGTWAKAAGFAAGVTELVVGE